MDLATVTFFTFLLVSACGNDVDSASAHMQCHSDHQCPDGFFCYEESQYCTHCVKCIDYKRKSSWRTCPKTPSDCGVCISGHEEEILHEGRTRDICIPFTPTTLSHSTVSGGFYERYIWAAAVTALLPILFYAFCRKRQTRDRGSVDHSLPHEEPPPYRSIELTTLTTNTEGILSEDDHVMWVEQQKDSLVQAVPFREPEYVESELMMFHNIQESNSEYIESAEDRVMATVELHDENTMPSDWTPAENARDGQLMRFELTEQEVSSEAEDIFEPASKRHKRNSTQEEESSNAQLNINLFINNKVTIHKPS